MAYTGKKPIDVVDVTQSQSLTVTDDLTVDKDILQNATDNTVKYNATDTQTIGTVLHPEDSHNGQSVFFSSSSTRNITSTWYGKYDGTDYIAQGAVDSINGGGLNLYSNNGTAWINGISMDDNGLVRHPKNVAFMVRASPSHSYSTTGWNKIIYDENLTQTGSSYSTSTSKFTAPRDGWYFFSATYSRNKTAEVDGTIAFNINSSASNDNYWGAASMIDGNDGSYDAGAISATIYLTENDTVEVRVYSTVAHTSRNHKSWAGTFTGRYVG